MKGNGHDIERIKRANDRLALLWNLYCQKIGKIPPEGSPEYNQVRRAFYTGAGLMKSEATLELLQRIATWRPLGRREVDLLTRFMRRQAPKRQVWRWTEEDDARVMALIRKRAAEGRPPPWQRNSEVKRLAKRLGRSYMAVHRRMERLRRQHGIPGNCSNGNQDQPGLN